MGHHVRPFQPDDAASVDDLWRSAFEGFEDDFPESAGVISLGAARVASMGWRVLVASDRSGASCLGAVRCWDDEGVAWLDMLTSARPFAGRDLVHEVQRWAQERGFRLLRLEIPAGLGLEAYFHWLGFVEVGGSPQGRLMLERRLPLLTVRAQRREDAAAIGELAGIDPWPFEQGARPGWFVLADGATVSGVVAVGESGFGEATVHTLVFAHRYRDRRLEPWMLERAGAWAETNGYHTVSVAASLVEVCPERLLEDYGWFRINDTFVRRDSGRPLEA